MLYGASPCEDISAESIGLKPVMNLMSQVIAIQHINIGDSVGYGSVFRAQKSMKVGVVACGYADGYPRHASTGTPVFIDNIFTTTIGRVSMDMLYVDITNIPNIDIGSSVELWGSHVPVDVIAKHSNTVGYELLCSISASKRVPLDYISG
jgi:alanine racemase